MDPQSSDPAIDYDDLSDREIVRLARAARKAGTDPELLHRAGEIYENGIHTAPARIKLQHYTMAAGYYRAAAGLGMAVAWGDLGNTLWYMGDCRTQMLSKTAPDENEVSAILQLFVEAAHCYGRRANAGQLGAGLSDLTNLAGKFFTDDDTPRLGHTPLRPEQSVHLAHAIGAALGQINKACG